MPAMFFRLLRFACLLGLFVQQLHAQAVVVHFRPMFAGRQLALPSAACATGNGRDTARITMLRFYVSNIRLMHGNEIAWGEKDSYHLVDAEDEQSLAVPLAVPDNVAYDHISFLVGIDSLTNAAGAQGGDLDATKGMYWAWQSGYINLKIEGTSPSCHTRKSAFEFHLGGYLNGNLCAQPVLLECAPGTACNIIVDVAEFLSGVSLATQNAVMIPGKEATRLSVSASGMFKKMAP